MNSAEADEATLKILRDPLMTIARKADELRAIRESFAARAIELHARRPAPRPPYRIDVAAAGRQKAQQREDGTA